MGGGGSWSPFPAYFSSHSPFSREHISCRFKQVSFSHVLVHCHPSSPTTGPTLFLRIDRDGIVGVCSVMCAQKRDHCYTSHPRKLGIVQLIPYPRRLQQNQMSISLPRALTYNLYEAQFQKLIIIIYDH